MKIHEKYLSRALQIAQNGLGTAAPNPSVGAVITLGERILGEGFTSPFGGPHAEVRAIGSVANPELLRSATLYVTLEPCCHHGKTPPCTDLILRSGIPRVVVGITDPHKKVAGQGIARLREAGCEVLVGVLQKECREHHRRFITFQEARSPYIILKWAQSRDGFIAPPGAKRETSPGPYWITGARSRQRVHQWRSEEQGILVGTRTALEDNPMLNARVWKGPSPLRILIDRELKVPPDFHIFGPGADTLVFCDADRMPKDRGPIRYRGLKAGVPVVEQVLEGLWEEQLLSVMVEGGAHTLQGFIEAGLWDEARILEGPAILGGGVRAPGIAGRMVAEHRLGSDRIRIIRHVAQSDI